ncbi:MAG: pectate lyase [Burkholderiales bacterium PBB3]|nr:MAG: pectate lyase [Burkholderiales bacterium PBB3]
MHPFATAVAVIALCTSAAAQAKPIGVIEPSQALTEARIALLSPPLKAAWQDYLNRSQTRLRADQAALAAERAGLSTVPPQPEGGNSEKSMPLDKPAAWYGSADALRVADNIVSFQTPSGGWGKNQPRDRPVRQPGQAYVSSNRSKFQKPGDFDAPEDENWSYVGTIDNDATITEIFFLSKVVAALPPPEAEKYRASTLRGLEYLLAAQFPNGGWPQVWPLQGGYHDAFTVNDNAIVEVAQLLEAVAAGQQDFAFVPPSLRERAQAAEKAALAGLLQAQVTVAGRKTLWAQQHDALTLAPTSARNYEPVALCSSESAAVLIYLMAHTNPSPAVIEAVEGGIATLRALAISGKTWRKDNELDGRRLYAAPGAAPLWARFYDANTQQPVFGDRDKTLHDDVADISLERRNGYASYGTAPSKALQAYAVWKQRGLPAAPSGK